MSKMASKRIGELNAYDVSGTFKWNSYSEITFTIDFKYTDILTGETKINPLFDKAEGLRIVEVENIGFFIIQDPDRLLQILVKLVQLKLHILQNTIMKNIQSTNHIDKLHQRQKIHMTHIWTIL